MAATFDKTLRDIKILPGEKAITIDHETDGFKRQLYLTVKDFGQGTRLMTMWKSPSSFWCTNRFHPLAQRKSHLVTVV